MMAKQHGMVRHSTLALIALLVLGGGVTYARDHPVEARMRRDLTFLASDECEGRGVTTHGIELAANYIARQFRAAGLRPAAGESYFQRFTMPANVLDGVPRLTLTGVEGQPLRLELGKQFEPLGLTGAGRVTAPLVFAGYGITATGKHPYDDYKGIDVAGKIVIVLRDTPRPGQKGGLFTGFERMRYASFSSKLQNAAKHGVAGILFVNDRDTASQRDILLHFEYISMAGPPGKLPAFHVGRAVVDRLLQRSLGPSLQHVESQIDRDLRPHSMPLPHSSAAMVVQAHRGTIPLKNVVGVLQGSGPLANETVVIGAHYDHLGYGLTSASLSGLKNPAIHHGADDNGSGDTALMELARRFAAMKDRQGRRLVFIAFTGEELGLLGSEYYVHHPLFPLSETAAMVNMDMVGRLRPDRASWKNFLAVMTPLVAGFPEASLAALAEGERAHLLPPGDKVIVYGTGSSPSFDAVINRIDRPYGFRLHKVPSGSGPSDQDSFYHKGIPVYFFFTDDHPDYHRPSDTVDKINFHGMAEVADMVADVVTYLATVPARPRYVKVPEPKMNRPEGNIPRLGIRPSYGDSDEGVLLAGVSEGGPAAKAGLKEGDRIVAIGGKPVKDLEQYMVLIMGHKPGQPLELGILRSGRKITVKVVPE